MASSPQQPVETHAGSCKVKFVNPAALSAAEGEEHPPLAVDADGVVAAAAGLARQQIESPDHNARDLGETL